MRKKKHFDPDKLNIALIVGAVILIVAIAVLLKVYSISISPSSSSEEESISVASQTIKPQKIKDEI